MGERNPGSESMVRMGEAARLAGVTPQQLQYYLLVGVIDPAAVSSGQQRLFDRQSIQQIKMIHLLNQSGYGLREIREIFMRRRPGRKNRRR